MKLLIVDDNAVNLRLLAAQLEGEGHEAVRARNGVEALAALGREAVDGVISDILMPEMDGYRLCLEVRNDHRHAALPFVLYTSTYNSPSDRELAESVGADAYLTKPAPVGQLLSAVEGARGRSGSSLFGKTVPGLDDQSVLRQYNQALVHKLEEKNAELVAANGQLAYQLQLTRSVTDRAAVSIFVVDEAGRVRFMNAQAEATFGWAGEDLEGRVLRAVLGMTHATGMTRPAGLEPEPAMHEHEDALRRRDGRLVPVLWSSAPIRLEGQRVGAVVTVKDQTESKRAADEIRALNEGLEQRVAERTRELLRVNAELEATNRELESFSYSASHDLRAPLRAIEQLTGLILADHGEAMPPEAHRYLGLIRRSTERMSMLIEDLLRFAKTARQPLHRTRVDVNALVRHCLDECAAEIERRAIDVRIEPLPDCDADPGLLRQVYANLIGNAVKYTRRQAAARIRIGSARDEAGRCVYSVSDNGAGFDMRQAERLFGVFQRLHSGAEFEGSGVGLAIVHRIVSRHGGEVWAESQPDRGSTFHFTLEEAPAARKGDRR